MRYTATDIIVSIIFTWGVCLTWPLLVRFAIVKRPISRSRAVCLSVLFFLVNPVIAYYLGARNTSPLPLVLVTFISYAIMYKGYYKKGSDIIVRKEKLKSENGEQNEDIPETTKTPQDNDGGSVTTSTVTTPLAVGTEQKKTTTAENSPPVETSSDRRIGSSSSLFNPIVPDIVVLIVLIIGFLLIISLNFGGLQNCYSQDATSQYNLGLTYFNGQGVEQDYKEAVKLFRKAAEQGNASAQCRLGAMYGIGIGVTEDYIEAYKWFLLAGMNGRDVTEVKEWLRSRMSHGQIAEAQRLAKAFE